MFKKINYLIAIVFFLSMMPVRGMTQTTPDDKADTTERAHRKHVVKKAWSDTKSTAKKGYDATAKESGKVWTGTKKTAKTVYHAPGKAIHKAKVKHQVREKQEGETK